MRFSWTGLLLAPLLVPVLLSAALAIPFSGEHPVFSFLVLLVPGCVIAYGTMIVLFLPLLFLLSRCRPMTGLSVCLLGLALGMALHVPVTWLVWGSSGVDSGPPSESFFVFFLRWTADPMAATFPVAGLVTAAAWWWAGTRRLNRRSSVAAS